MSISRRLAGWVLLLPAALVGCDGSKSDRTDPPKALLTEKRHDEEVDPSVPPLFGYPPVNTGIEWVHTSGDSEVKPFPAANGSGLGVIDYDLDGLPDLFFANGTEFPIDLATSKSRDAMFRNLGEWTFQDVGEAVGIGFPGYSIGVSVADYDNDGFPDLYVTCYGENLLYHNQGDGSFIQTEHVAGVADKEWATSAMFFDANNDGLLDLYVGNYGFWTLEGNLHCSELGVRLYCNPKLIEPCHDKFFFNQGDGTFRDATQEVGLETRPSRTQGVIAMDLTDDGYMDIYLGNDLSANSLFINDGTGKFTDQTELSAVAYDQRGNSQAGMGVDAADFDRNGHLDLFVTNFKDEYNSLYESRGPGLFFEVSSSRGVAMDSMPYVAWGTGFADFNLDGWLDLFVVNGHVDNNRHLKGEDAPFKNPDLVWLNDQGMFRCMRKTAGEPVNELHSGRGMAIVDLDNDGDEDVVVGNQQEKPSLIQNLTRSPSSNDSTSPAWIQFQWIGHTANRSGIGVKYTLFSGDEKWVDQVTAGGSYLSASSLISTLALPDSVSEFSLEVTFPGGSTFPVEGLQPNRRYVIIEGQSADEPPRVIELSP